MSATYAFKATAFEAETKNVLAQNPRLAVQEYSGGRVPRSSDPIALGRALNVRYVVRTVVTEGAGEARADVSLFDAKAGVRIAASPELLTMGKPKFARGLYKIIYPAVARRQATVLSALEQNFGLSAPMARCRRRGAERPHHARYARDG